MEIMRRKGGGGGIGGIELSSGVGGVGIGRSIRSMSP